MNFIQFLQTDFLHAAPVLAAGLVAIAIVLERIRALMYVYPLKNRIAFFDKVSDLIKRDETSQAVALCDQHIESPVAKVVKTGLMRSHLPEDAIEQGMAITLSEVSKNIQKRTSFLATIANVATLMGLFGTIVGLIASFNAVASADPAKKSELLSAGISTAMNATMLGLGVAIPCMVAFAFLMNKSNGLLSESEEAALKTLDMLRLRDYQSAQTRKEAV